jgi:transposase-like zinc ribbon protein
MILAAIGRPGYPKTMRKFRDQLSSRAACLDYLVRSRWPDRFTYPDCGGKTPTSIRNDTSLSA